MQFRDTLFKPDPLRPIDAFVHSGGIQAAYTNYVNQRLFTSVEAALSMCRENGTIVCLPGHVEQITGAGGWANLRAGVTVMGCGPRTQRAKIRFTAAASNVTVAVQGVRLVDLDIEACGDPADSGSGLIVSEPFSVNADGFELHDCYVIASIGSRRTGFAFDVAGDHFKLVRTTISSTGSASATPFRLVGADFWRLEECLIDSLAPVGASTASLNGYARDCVFINATAASTHAFVGVSGATGVFHNCGFGVRDNATLVGVSGSHSYQFFGCYTSNVLGENGAATTPVSA